MKKISNIVDHILKNKDSAFFFTPPYYKDAKSVLFLGSSKKITASNKAELDKLLNSSGIIGENNGFLLMDYEAGYLFEEKLNKKHDGSVSAKLFLTNEADIKTYTSNDLEYDLLSNYTQGNISEPELDTNETDYIKAIEEIKSQIKEGFTYQVNFTIRAYFSIKNFYEFFSQMVFNQTAEYISLINDDGKIIFSVSPELFFRVENNTIFVEPMKGTIKRGGNLTDDAENISVLKSSEKDSAENLMIVDLLRNDIGKICQTNSVIPTELKSVKSYESLHQMITRVKGKLKTERYGDIFNALFPSGSITGAPKIKTMEIIHSLETSKRGIYTGTIGFFTKDDTVFNIPIRTFEIKDKNVRFGLGSGIVWDSDAKAEYEEVKLKGSFFNRSENWFYLFETMLIENGGVFLLERHMTRLSEASIYFLFCFNKNEIFNEICEIVKKLDNRKKYKLKLKIYKWGEYTIEYSEINPDNKGIKIVISDNRIDSGCKYQFFKTSNRKLYDEEYYEYSRKGFGEVIYLNEKDKLGEGAISNILIGNSGQYYTPELKTGILNGCLRQELIDSGKIVEKEIALDELINADEVYIFNSVRKLIAVKSVSDSYKTIAQYSTLENSRLITI